MTLIVEMRVAFAAPDVENAARMKSDLLLHADQQGWTPKFYTCEEWLWNSQFETPLPFSLSRGIAEAEHTGKLSSRRDRKGAQ